MNIDMDKVPLTVEEAIDMFSAALDKEEKEAFLQIKENQICIFHYTWGTVLRNSWSMFEKNTPLVNDFLKMGISHADDMTSVILTSSHRKFKKKPVDIKNQIKLFKAYWLKEIGREMP